MDQLHAEILDVDIGAEADVVGEVPAYMVRIVVDDDVVGVPEPAVTEGDVEGGDMPVPAVEPEAVRSAACQMPSVCRAETTGEAAVSEGMIDVIVGVAAAGVMADPGSSIDVGGVGVAVFVRVIAVSFGGVRIALIGAGSMGGGCLMAASLVAATLGKRRY